MNAVLFCGKLHKSLYYDEFLLDGNEFAASCDLMCGLASRFVSNSSFINRGADKLNSLLCSHSFVIRCSSCLNNLFKYLFSHHSNETSKGQIIKTTLNVYKTIWYAAVLL